MYCVSFLPCLRLSCIKKKLVIFEGDEVVGGCIMPVFQY